jgi:glycosyltransferase involved in cell wall biosynthesis
MRVVKVVPGSGGTFYCENCMRDLATIKALKRAGAHVVMVPMYLPMYADDPDVARDVPVFFGGINAYLQQRFGLFRRTPRWLDRLFDSRPMLRLAARMEGSTKAAGLGEMTLSMIRGEEGNQAKELERLADWLGGQERPDVIHLSTVMLVGLARRLKAATGAPVVCSVQDEDVWIDKLDAPYNERCWDALAERGRDVARFIAVSDYYGDVMRRRLRVEADRFRTVHIGMDLDGYRPAPLTFDPPVIGYLSKLTPSLGLGDLVEAFIELKRRPGLERLRLRAMGGIVGADRRYVEGLRKRLTSLGLAGDAEFLPEVDRESRIRFLESLSVLSVPIPGGEAFGMFLVEAWAGGLPVVQPRAGAFPELVERTGGGMLYDPHAPGALTAALESLLRDPERARRLGRAGQGAAAGQFRLEHMAANLLKVYGSVVTTEGAS